ncbi:hypothetical protein PIB30_006620 [Stylosanthes scabra]|uniref:Uncharacterized protein n=1 Tax=Stylosanthes scabra TaxID=79078 RepID=A0ABU6Q5B3_9FABA|nr:hypothetical protein [Stylosanthes scabra]
MPTAPSQFIHCPSPSSASPRHLSPSSCSRRRLRPFRDLPIRSAGSKSPKHDLVLGIFGYRFSPSFAVFVHSEIFRSDLPDPNHPNTIWYSASSVIDFLHLAPHKPDLVRYIVNRFGCCPFRVTFAAPFQPVVEEVTNDEGGSTTRRVAKATIKKD